MSIKSPILLIEELKPSECGLLQEASPDGKSLWLSGIFMQAGIKNRNGRVYPVTEISTAVDGAKQRMTEQNGIMGELDHPQSLQINLDRVSHVITELHMQGNDAYGKARLLNTPMGNIARELINSNVKVGVSSRGAGNVNEGGDVSGFQFVTVDIVAQPSAPGAYPGSIYESLELAKNGHNIVSLAEDVRNDPAAQKYLKKEILKWLSNGLFTKN
ncbi:hypothetical protein E4H12_12460 [Candidatus Thorarchaeota archaeon]|nr:MAG: hypothetical protein E4H12_12460 [Candidatus Thorarchaeota archaeon]